MKKSSQNYHSAQTLTMTYKWGHFGWKWCVESKMTWKLRSKWNSYHIKSTYINHAVFQIFFGNLFNYICQLQKFQIHWIKILWLIWTNIRIWQVFCLQLYPIFTLFSMVQQTNINETRNEKIWSLEFLSSQLSAC